MTDPRRALLARVAAGELDVDAALAQLADASVEALGFATLDHERAWRRGLPEVVLGSGKEPEDLAEIVVRLADRAPNVLATRVSASGAAAVRRRVPEATWDDRSRVLQVWRDRAITGRGTVLVVAAGTSDLPVALEAEHCLQVMGQRCDRLVDVGVAGLHRLLAATPALRAASVVITVAGMEAALPSVVAGLVDVPVIAVPTSVGYGASFGGLAALLGCLNACSAGVVTVNIDNGFGAAYAAALITRDRS
ncbi:MAG: NCAIR mutase (PurE)-related protein [Myxococcota bacterium]|jgi:NCAIR mutase (PurE)-related protein